MLSTALLQFDLGLRSYRDGTPIDAVQPAPDFKRVIGGDFLGRPDCGMVTKLNLRRDQDCTSRGKNTDFVFVHEALPIPNGEISRRLFGSVETKLCTILVKESGYLGFGFFDKLHDIADISKRFRQACRPCGRHARR